jgi:tetratricopeptide (TPR) repeat protein
MKKTYGLCALFLAFVLGAAAGGWASKKAGVEASFYSGRDAKDAGLSLLELAKSQAGQGSWESISVGRTYYLGGQKAEGQAIFDQVIARKAKASDWIRIGRIYYAAGEWDKAKAAFERTIQMEPKDLSYLAEVGAYYNLHGDRSSAEKFFDQVASRDRGDLGITTTIAGSYLGVTPN